MSHQEMQRLPRETQRCRPCTALADSRVTTEPRAVVRNRGFTRTGPVTTQTWRRCKAVANRNSRQLQGQPGNRSAFEARPSAQHEGVPWTRNSLLNSSPESLSGGQKPHKTTTTGTENPPPGRPAATQNERAKRLLYIPAPPPQETGTIKFHRKSGLESNRKPSASHRPPSSLVNFLKVPVRFYQRFVGSLL